MKEKLSQKEKLFCSLYTSTFNVRESAYRAGYKLFPEKAGIKLLQNPAISQRIKEEVTDQVRFSNYKDIAATGLKRIAFSGISDALKILFSDSVNQEDLDNLDLFMISEIKKPKTGGLEIKFFDRIKALEHLSELSNGSVESEISPFYNALTQGAEAIKSTGGEEE